MPASIKWICIVAITILAPFVNAQNKPPTAAAAQQPVLSPQDVHPTLITLHLHKAALAEVIKEISKQSGVAIQFNGNSDATLALDADQQPFWQVLEDACVQAHSGVQGGFGDGDRLQINAGFDDAQSHVVIAGPILAKFQQIEHLSQMTSSTTTRDFCDLQVTAMWEPRLAVAFFETSSVPTVAVDENGLSLVPSADVIDPRNSSEQKYQYSQRNNGNSLSFQHSIRLKIPAQAGRHIVRLGGQFRIWVSGNTAQVTIADLPAAARSKPKLNVEGTPTQLQITAAWIGDGQAQIQLQASQGDDEASDAWNQRKCLLHAVRVHLFDSSDKPWGDSIDQGFYYGVGNEQFQDYLQIRRNSGVTTAPKKAVFDVPTSATEIDVPYDLHDLPLP